MHAAVHDGNRMSQTSRTFTYRAFLIGLAATLVMGFWIHFHEVLLPANGIIAENSPPASAIGALVGVVVIAGILTSFSGAFRLARGELVVIYTMLVISAPIMSQGMWHRFLGLMVAIPHNVDNLPLIDSYSDKLWPHGPHLVADRTFNESIESHGRRVSAPDRVSIAPKEMDTPAGMTRVVVLSNPAPGEGSPAPPADAPAEQAVLTIPVPRYTDDGEALVPGERYFITALVKADEFKAKTSLSLELESDGGQTVPVFAVRRNTDVTFAAVGGFMRVGQPYLAMPRDVDKGVNLTFRLTGPGTASVTDVVMFSNEALARLHKGSTEVAASDLARLPENNRDAMLVRPESAVGQIGYALAGYIPYRQWATPLIYWVSIVMAMFLGLLGLGVILRKQWADIERFSFPLIVLPKLLIDEKEDGQRVIRPIYRDTSFKVGIVIAMAYALLQGMAYYVPGLPNPTVALSLEDAVTSPAWKTFFHGMAGSEFRIVLLFASIAFFIDLDLLLSIIIFFWLSKVPYFFGEVFGWKNIKGPVDNYPFPYSQHAGAFLSLALIVLWVSRKHLIGVARRVLGLRDGTDDSDEPISYRAALVLIVGAFGFFALWGMMSGLGAGSALLFFGFLMICGLSASRIRTECGLPMTYFTPYYPYLIFFLLGGLARFGLPTLVLAFMAGGFMAVAQFLMFAPSQVEMLQLGKVQQASSRGVTAALTIGMLLGVLIGGYLMLVWSYGRGAENVQYMRSWAVSQNWYFNPLNAAVREADQSVQKTAAGLADDKPYPVGSLIGVGAGAGITLGLTAMRTHFVGFWLHPIGYILANTHFVHGAWGSLLIAWIVKWLGLKVGGPRLVREKLTPAAAGIFVGAVAGIVMWDIVALVLMSRGARDLFSCLP